MKCIEKSKCQRNSESSVWIFAVTRGVPRAQCRNKKEQTNKLGSWEKQ